MNKRIFRRLVLAGFIQNLALSITGMIDCAIVGQYIGTDGLSAMKLAMPVFSLLSLFSTILGTGLSVIVSRDLTRGGDGQGGQRVLYRDRGLARDCAAVHAGRLALSLRRDHHAGRRQL